MREVEVRPLRDGDAAELVANMRPADVAEINACWGPDIESAVFFSIKESTWVRTATADGQLGCIMGVGPAVLLSNTGRPWLLGTPVMDSCPFSLGRRTMIYLYAMLDEYPHLENWVDVRHIKSINWLKKLGFTIHPPEPFGRYGLPFHRFDMGS